jgi:MFS transporter, ACS family, hexuronate transporter
MTVSSVPRRVRTIPNLRWWIGGLLFASTIINYIDRQTLAVLAPLLKVEFHWNNKDWALVLIGFRLAYAIGQAGAGKFLDRVGTRAGLTLTVAWYSAIAMLTSTVRGLWMLAGFRFCSGLGEAANWPGATKAVSEWFPRRERGFGVALFDSGSAIGAIVALLVVPRLLHVCSWRVVFLLTGTLAMSWVFLWRKVYYSPETHPRISKEER